MYTCTFKNVIMEKCPACFKVKNRDIPSTCKKQLNDCNTAESKRSPEVNEAYK